LRCWLRPRLRPGRSAAGRHRRGADAAARDDLDRAQGQQHLLQIVDRDKLLNGPKEPTPENLLYPQVGRLDLSTLVGAHTTFTMLHMKLAEFAHDKKGSVRGDAAGPSWRCGGEGDSTYGR